MVKEVEELIKIVGKGNLLEALFIFLGSLQHVDIDHDIDRRNHIGLSAFIKKTREPLDEYFNLKFSLQGLFFIYAKAYNILAENDQLSTQEVIDKIYNIGQNELRNELPEVINLEQPEENEEKLKLLNILANPKSETLFHSNDDFENQVLKDIKELLKTSYTNKSDKSCALIKCVIDYYYTIHKDIKVNKDVALLFSRSLSLDGNHEKRSSSNTVIKKEILKMYDNVLIFLYIMHLANVLRNIELPSKNGLIKYTFNHKDIGNLNSSFNMFAKYAKEDNQAFLHPKSIGPTLKLLLKNQNSKEFERRVADPKNIYYSAPQKENGYVPNFNTKKEGKNTKYKSAACLVILGAVALSLAVCIVDYLFVEQKLLQPIKDILPQDNFTNLAIAAVLTIIVVYAVFQLLKLQQEPPELPSSRVNEIGDVLNGSVASSDIPQGRLSNIAT